MFLSNLCSLLTPVASGVKTEAGRGQCAYGLHDGERDRGECHDLAA